MSAQGDVTATPADGGTAEMTVRDGTDLTDAATPGRGRRIRAFLAGGDEPLARGHRLWLIAIVAAAGALRLAWAIYATKEPRSLMAGGDAYAYFYYGKQIAAGGGYISVIGDLPEALQSSGAAGHATAYYPIGYPALLGGLFWVVQHTPLPDNLPMAGSLMQVVLSTVSVFLLFAIGRRLFGTRVGLIAAAILAFFPNIIFYVATFQLETTFIFLALLLVLVGISHDWRAGMPSRRYLLGFGTLLGLTAEVRPFILPFLIGLGAAALVAGLGWRKAATAMAWPMLALVIVCTPWTIRNNVAMGSPVPFSTNGGDTLCMDRGPGANGKFRWAMGEACAPPTANEVTRNAESPRLALKYTLKHPDEELALIPKRFYRMMEQDHDGLRAVESGKAGRFLGDRMRSNLGRVADWYFFATGFLALAGVAVFFRGRRPDRLFAGVGILTLLIVPLGLWGNIRFHVPLLPFFALATAVSVTWVWDRLRPDRTPAPNEHDPDGPTAPPVDDEADADADAEVGASAR